MKILRILSVVLLMGFVGCDDDDGWIEIRNESGRAIESVTITPCDATTQGPNLLNSGTISDGDSEAFEVDFGCYDVEVRTTDGLPGNWEVVVNSGQKLIVLIAQVPAVDG